MINKRQKDYELIESFVEELKADPVLAAREILGVELAPHERVALRGMWTHKWNMHVWGRGCGKTFMLAVFAALVGALYANEKIILIGPGFRQAQLIFRYIEGFVLESEIFADCLRGGPSKGIKHNANEYSMEFKNGSMIIAVPLGVDGSKIRGYRATRLLIDEVVQVPPEIINKVLIPFMSTSKNPMAEYLGQRDGDEDGTTLVFATSAYYTFNHAYSRYCSFLKKIVVEKDDRYFLTNFNFEDTPKGFIDMDSVELARSQSTEADFLTEWMAVWVTDTQGFYPASLIDKVGSLNIYPELKGSADAQYVLGVDPAESWNTCGLVLCKIGEPYEIVRVESLENSTYPEICSRILEYMSNYNIVRIGLDKGGGSPIVTLFKEGRPFVQKNGSELTLVKLLTVDDDSGVDGRRIIEMIPATSQSVTELNMSMKAAMESGLIRWPKIAGGGSGEDLLAKEAIISEIKEMESEFRMIEATVTKSGWYSFSVPAHKNKDRYSAALFALSSAMSYANEGKKAVELPTGFWGKGIMHI